MSLAVRIDVPLSFKAYRLSSLSIFLSLSLTLLLITISYVQNQTTTKSTDESARGDERCFVKRFAKSLLPATEHGAKTTVKITGPFFPLRARHPFLRPRTSPSHTLCPPADAACVHVFLSAVSALCCTNRGRLPKVHATRPRLIIILRRIVDPVRPAECRKRRKTKPAYEFGRLQVWKTIGGRYLIRDNKG